MLMTCAVGSRRRRNRGPSEQDHHSDHSMRAGLGASQVNATSDVKNVLPPALGILWTTAAVAPRTLLLLTLPGYGLPKPQCAAAVRRPLEAAPASSVSPSKMTGGP